MRLPLRVEARGEVSRPMLVIAPFAAVAFTLVVASLFVAWAGAPLLRTYALIFDGGFGSSTRTVQPASSSASTTCVPMNPDPPVTATILSNDRSFAQCDWRSRADRNETMTCSACSSVRRAEMGKQMCDAQMRSAPGNEPFAQGSKTGCRCSGSSYTSPDRATPNLRKAPDFSR